jgi:hypothetical protein
MALSHLASLRQTSSEDGLCQRRRKGHQNATACKYLVNVKYLGGVIRYILCLRGLLAVLHYYEPLEFWLPQPAYIVT